MLQAAVAMPRSKVPALNLERIVPVTHLSGITVIMLVMPVGKGLDIVLYLMQNGVDQLRNLAVVLQVHYDFPIVYSGIFLMAVIPYFE